MKKLLLASAAFSALATTALAADLPAQTYTKAQAYAVPAPYSWTGFYIGGHIGGAFSDGGNSFGGSNDGRFIGGGQIGADYQFSSNWLVGAEAQYSYVDRNNGNSFAFPGGTFNHDLRGLGSVTGRLGYTWGSTLLYAKGGYAYADTKDSGAGAFQFSDGRDGYTVGAGIEYLFSRNWSGKIEYQYFDFGRHQLFVGTPLALQGNVREDEQTIKVGLNYRFNSGIR